MNLKEFLIVYIEEKKEKSFCCSKEKSYFCTKNMFSRKFYLSFMLALSFLLCSDTAKVWAKKKIQNLSSYFGRNLTFLMVVSLILNYGVGCHVLRICGQSGILIRLMLSSSEMADWFAG